MTSVVVFRSPNTARRAPVSAPRSTVHSDSDSDSDKSDVQGDATQHKLGNGSIQLNMSELKLRMYHQAVEMLKHMEGGPGASLQPPGIRTLQNTPPSCGLLHCPVSLTKHVSPTEV